MDTTDYQWSLSLPMFRPFQPKNFRRYEQSLVQDLKSRPGGMFISGYAAVLTSLDTELHNEDEVMAALDYLVPQSARPGRYLPMPGTIPEIVDMTDGDMYHDVRPIVFSIAPWLSAVTNLGCAACPLASPFAAHAISKASIIMNMVEDCSTSPTAPGNHLPRRGQRPAARRHLADSREPHRQGREQD